MVQFSKSHLFVESCSVSFKFETAKTEWPLSSGAEQCHYYDLGLYITLSPSLSSVLVARSLSQTLSHSAHTLTDVWLLLADSLMYIIITDVRAKFYANWIISEHKLDLHECTIALKRGLLSFCERQKQVKGKMSSSRCHRSRTFLLFCSCCCDLCFIDWTERYKCYRPADRLLEPAAGSLADRARGLWQSW